MTITQTDPVADPVLPARRRRSRRSSPLLWVAVAFGLLCALGYLLLVNGAAGSPVAVAVRDVAAGEPVGPGDFRFVDLVVPAELADQVLRAPDVNQAVSRVTTHALVAGQLVQRSDLVESAGPAQQRAMSIPVDPTAAVGGALRVGDLVDVVDASSSEAAYVLTGARVLAVADTGSGRLGAGAGKYAVTVAVDAPSALRVAAAIAAGKLAVIRSTGAPTITPTPPTTAVRR